MSALSWENGIPRPSSWTRFLVFNHCAYENRSLSTMNESPKAWRRLIIADSPSVGLSLLFELWIQSSSIHEISAFLDKGNKRIKGRRMKKEIKQGFHLSIIMPLLSSYIFPLKRSSLAKHEQKKSFTREESQWTRLKESHYAVMWMKRRKPKAR